MIFVVFTLKQFILINGFANLDGIIIIYFTVIGVTVIRTIILQLLQLVQYVNIIR